MDMGTAEKLVRATNDFYAAQCESFSQTRQAPWKGWSGLLPYVAKMAEPLDASGHPLNVLDLGCGNLRFERFLADALPKTKIAAYAFDSCKPLADLGSDAFKGHFKQLNIIDALKDGALPGTLDACPKCDLGVAFGFMHHVPLPEWRTELLLALLRATATGGLICASFWQPGNSQKLLAKLEDVTPRGCDALGIELSGNAGDYLLDWQKDESAFRYVHDFSDEEIEALTEEACKAGATLVKAYSADGRTGDLNRYVILQRDVD